MSPYIAVSANSKEILNSAQLLQNLELNALIIGEQGVGKKTLAKYILEDVKVFKAKNLQDDISDNIISLQNCAVIIEHIENITNIDLLLNWIETNHIRIIATTLKEDLNLKLKDLFSITIEIPPFSKREDDVIAIAKKFSKEAADTLLAEQISTSKMVLNISNNAHSLRKSVYFSYLFEVIGEKEILMFMENYMYSNLEGENSYKDFIHLFEVPLLNASQKKYKSQVQMAKHLGLNRITLRKKLEIHKDLLDG